jgi:hypothetical protein
VPQFQWASPCIPSSYEDTSHTGFRTELLLSMALV